MAKNNGYDLSRRWFDFAFENTAKVTSGHTALFMWLCEINNRLGWVAEFQITAGECMAGMSCKSYKTYKKALDDLILFGFVKMVKQSVNQYQCNIIGLVNNTEASTKALDKALLRHLPKHLPKQVHSTYQSTSHIHKQETRNQEPLNQKPETIPTEVGHEYHSPKITEDEEKKKVAEKKKSADEMYPAFLALVNKYTGRKFRESDKSRSNFRARVLSGFTLHDFETALKNVIAIEYHQSNGFRYITPEFITREEKLQMYSVPTNQKSQVSDNSSVAHMKVYL